LRLGFAGTPQFAVPALDALLRSRHRVVGVFTQPDRPAGRGQSMHMSAVKQHATLLGLDVHQPSGLKTAEAEAMLRSLELDALVVVAYGLILPPAVLAVPHFGCFNIHASLLPRWRGAAPIQRALLAGDATTGVTIMRMEAGLDTGPMLAVREVPIEDRETAAMLHDRLARLGGELMVETLDAVASGTARESAQPASGVTYAEKINKAEALIDWREDATCILRRVRAFNPWPVAETKLDGAQLRVWEAELTPAAPGAVAELGLFAASGAVAELGLPAASGAVAELGSPAASGSAAKLGSSTAPGSPAAGAPPGTVVAASSAGVDVACGRGTLRILRLQLPGRKPLAAQEFIKAQRLAGARFASP
jgi:methionyl-tRNA formyltransferase